MFSVDTGVSIVGGTLDVGLGVDQDHRPVVDLDPRDRPALQRAVGAVHEPAGHVLQPDLVTLHRLGRPGLAADQRLPLALVGLVAAVLV